MTRDELRTLLRMRAEALAPPAEVVDRALARCARIGVRQGATSGRRAAASQTTPASAVAAPTVATAGGGPAPDAQATAISVGAPPAPGATVPSLSQRPAQAQPGGLIEPGTIVAGYRIESLLGKGGMGAVYRATQLSMNRPVAFKVLAERFAGDPTFVGRFKREARAAGRLHHHHLVTVHDSGEADGLVFFSMELVEGRSLKELLKERGRLPPDEALRIARQVLEALAYAHGRGVVHRDIKPDNVMLNAAGSVKVADLGLSRIDERGAGDTTELFQTTVGSFMGTPHYMAPEQGRDAHGADHRCDLYALGATLFHLVTGRQPFTGSTAMEVLVAAQTQPLVWPDPAPPAAAREFIARLMEKEPDRRPADAEEAIRLLDRVLQPPTVQPRPPRRTWPRVRGALLTAAGIAMAVAMVAAALHAVRESEADRAWNAALAAAERDADARDFAKALTALRRARDGMPDDALRAAACDEAVATVSRRWDDWARANIDATERKVRELLTAGRYQDALDRLRDVPESWRGPEAEQRLEALQRAWEEAVAKDAERRRDGGSESAGLLEQIHEGRRRAVAEMWKRAEFSPAAAVQQRDGRAVFSGSGSGSIPLPAPSGALAPLVLRIAWRGEAAAGARWEMRLGDAARLVVGADGAAVMGSRGTHALPRLDDGSYGLAVLQRAGGLVAAIRDRRGEPAMLPLPAAGTPCAVRWELDRAEVSLAVGGRR